MANPNGKVMDDAPEGFYFVEDGENEMITIAYNSKLWEPIWDGEVFVGYKRKA